MKQFLRMGLIRLRGIIFFACMNRLSAGAAVVGGSADGNSISIVVGNNLNREYFTRTCYVSRCNCNANPGGAFDMTWETGPSCGQEMLKRSAVNSIETCKGQCEQVCDQACKNHQKGSRK